MLPAGKSAAAMMSIPGVIKLKYALLIFCLLAALFLQGCAKEKTEPSSSAVPPVSDTVTQSTPTGSKSLSTAETISDNGADADVWDTGSKSADKKNSGTSSKTVSKQTGSKQTESKQISSNSISSVPLSSQTATDSRAALVPDKEVFR